MTKVAAFVVALLVSVSACRSNAGTMPTESGWVPLFDGRTLAGWRRENGTAAYQVEDGSIVGRTAVGSPNSFLVTEKAYGDFELELEVKVDPGLNSGIQIRSRTREAAVGNARNEQVGRVFGPQVEIESTGEDGSEAGYLYAEAAGGWMTPPERLRPHKRFRDREWNHYRVIAQGPRIQTFINGEKVEDLTHPAMYASHPSGFIGLQVHGIPAGAGPYEVRWRNLRIRELGR